MMEARQWRVGASAAVVREDRVLMIRHTYGEKQEYWGLPGGYATHDERLDQTAIREVWEETGLMVAIVDVIGLRTQYSPRGGAVFVLFRARPLSGEPAPDGGEVNGVDWFSAGQIAALSDEDLLPVARNAGLAALRGGPGLGEDTHLPGKSDTCRGFLIAAS